MATVELTWDDNSDNEDGFRVYRSTTPSPSFPADYSKIDTVGANDTDFTDTNAPSGTVYYAVTAYNSAGESVETTTSIETVTAPSTPQNLSFTDTATEDELSFSWDSVDWGGEQGDYQIYRAEASGTTRSDYSQVATVAAGTTSYTDTGLEDGERYFYRVGATNSAGDSGLSNEIDATTVLPAATLGAQTDGFEDNELDEWNVNALSTVTDRTFNGSHAAYGNTALTDTYIAERTDLAHESGDTFSLYWQETSGSYGGGFRLWNSNGNVEVGVATDNPEWDIDDANGLNQVYGGDGYDRWVYVEITPDFGNGTYDIFIEDQQSGATFSDTRSLKHGVDFSRLTIEDYNNFTWRDGSSHEMWWDDISFSNGVTVDSGSVTVSWTNNDESPDGGIDVERTPPDAVVFDSSIHGKDIAVQQDGYGTWVAVQNYEHYGGTNPSVGPADTFPQLSDGVTTADDIEASGSNGELRHVDDIDQYGSFEVDAVRLEATTTNHSRKIHFFTTDQTVIDATFTEQSDETDYTDFQGSPTTFYDDHTANLPVAAENGDADTRSDRIFGTGFPFYNGGNYHWAVKGTGNRWEVDNYPDDNGSGYQFSTVHRVWVRVTGETEATVLANAFETVESGLSPSTTEYTDTSVAEGTTYEYRVERSTDHATATSGTGQVTTPIERFVTAEGTADATVSRTAPTARSATGAGAGDATVARTATPARSLTADGDRGDATVSRATTSARSLLAEGAGDAGVSWIAPDAWALPKTPGSSTDVLLTPSGLSTTYDELTLTATVSEAKRELLDHYRRAGDVARQTTAFGAFRRIRRDGDDLLTVRPPADSAPPFADRRVAPVDMSADQVAPRRHQLSLTLGLEEPRAREPIEGDDEAITVDTATLDVAGGETETATLSWTPDGTQLGDWTATVSSETDSDATLVTVSDAPWTFAWPVATLSLTERRVGQVARGSDAGLPSIELPLRLDAGQVATILAVGSRVEAVEARSVPDGPNTVVDTLPGDELTCQLDPPTASDIEAGTYVLRDWSVERARPAPPAYDATVTLVRDD